MADKVYVEVEATIMVPTRVRFSLVVRTEPGSNVDRAVQAWIKAPWKMNFRDGDVEVVRTDELGPRDTVEEFVQERTGLNLVDPTVNLVDAK